MVTKRRVILATAVFIFVGLLLVTFANPSEVKEEAPEQSELSGDQNKNADEKIEKKENITENTATTNTTINEDINRTTIVEPASDPVVRPTTENNGGGNESTNNARAAALTKLKSLLDYDKENYTSDSYAGYEKLVTEVNTISNGDLSSLSDEQITDYINKLEEAIKKLVNLKLISLDVTPNNDEYKRFESQKKLTFVAIYNDSKRNKNVEATTEDEFDTRLVVDAKTMNYTYTDKFGSANVVYNYSVVKNDRDLLLDKLKELQNTEINEEDYTSESVDNLNDLKDIDGSLLSKDEIEKLIEQIEDAIENLVKLELTGLEVTPNNTEYKRLETQKELTFTAIYNDETRNKNVTATTEDTFSTDKVTEKATMTYTYTDKYGKVSAKYNYSVVKNDRDLLLDKLEELQNTQIDEEDYTKESVDNLKEAQDVDPSDLSNEEIEEAIEAIEEAIENLVKLELTGLEVTPNNDEYKRFESQKELTFTAIYNDETRNKTVKATTEDEFSTNKVTEKATMTYTYTDKYGKVSTDYNYSVVQNDRDKVLEELINTKVNEEDYTSESVEDLKEAQNIDPSEYTSEEVEEAIEKIEEAIENLVKLELTGLEVTPNNDEYKRFENQKTLTFTAVYNDKTRNKTVKATTTDEFSTDKVTEKTTMTYTYTDKYGKVSTDYNYSVIKNDRDKVLEELINTKVNEEDYTSDSVEDLKEAQDIDPSELTSEEVEEAIEKIEDAIENLVKLELTGLEVTPNNTEYKRLEEQKELTFTAIYNDETRNKTVNATTEDTFSTEKVTEKVAMTYTYSDKYGKASATYNYSVVKNDRDLLLDELYALLAVTINEEDYTSDSVKVYNDSKNVNPEELTNDEIKEAIENIKEAYNNLVALELTGLEVTPNNDEYKRLENQKTLAFTAIYNDKTRNKTVNATTDDKFDSETNGSKSMIYTYTDKYGKTNVTYNYTVVRNDDDKVITGITAELSQTEFGYLTNVDIKDYLTVYAVAKDSVKTKITDYSVSGFSTQELASEKSLTITSGKFSTSLNYSVVRTEEGKQLKSLAVSLNKKEYNWKETKYSMTVTATDNDDITHIVTNDAIIIKPFDTSKVGEKEFEVSYTQNGITKTASTTYTVVRTKDGMVLDYITATFSNPVFKRATTENVKDRLIVTAFDIDGTSYEVAAKDYKTSKFNVSKIGEYPLTITYTKNGVKKTAEVKYTVVKNDNDLAIKNVNVTLDKKNYKVNEQIEGLKVEVTYGDKTKEIITTCTNDFDSTTAGYNKTLTVTCNGVNGATTYSVSNDELKGISVTLNREDNRYTTDSEIYAIVVYTDEYGRTNELNKNDYKVTPALSTASAGTYTSTISYNGYTDTVTYTVSESYLFNVRIVDKKLVEIKETYDDFIDITEIKVTYSDGTSKTFKASKGEIEMTSYDSVQYGFFTTIYINPTYQTDNFEKVKGNYKTPVQIEVFYGKAKNSNSQYHAYKLTYTVNNDNVVFAGHSDLGYNYY